MITFRNTMDPHSQDIYLHLHCDDKPKLIGRIQWHPERPPRIYWESESPFDISLTDMRYIVDQLDTKRKGKRQWG